jgi:hypothetical protein
LFLNFDVKIGRVIFPPSACDQTAYFQVDKHQQDFKMRLLVTSSCCNTPKTTLKENSVLTWSQP